MAETDRAVVALIALVVIAPSTRPDDRHVATVVKDDIGTTIGLDGDAVLSAVPTLGSNANAWDPDGKRTREIYDTADIKTSFAEDIQAIARHDDVLYLSVSGQGVLRVPKEGRASMIAFRPVPDDLDGEPEGNRQRIADFYPSRLAAAPDGTLYILSKNRVFRYDGKQVTQVNTPALDDPQDIAVDTRNRLYIADTGNGRVLRGGETLIGASAPEDCVNQGQSNPGSLVPTACHAVEALAVDSKGNLFLAVGGVPRVLALTAEGRFGVVAGTGIAGIAKGDGRAVSARIGAVNKLEVGPDDDLYVGEYERALRIADPVGGLGATPRLEADGPPEVCAAIGKWGAATQQAHFTTGATPPDLDALRAPIAGLDGEDDLREEFTKRYVDQERLAKNSTAGNLLRAYGDEHCNLFDGTLAVEPRQAMRFRSTYAREWDKVDRLRARDPRRDVPAQQSAPLLPAEIFPPNAPRTPGWTEQVDQFARRACAISYRWSTRFID